VAEGIEARLSEKIGLAMLICVAFALSLAGLAVFPTLILIGVLATREFTDSLTSVHIVRRVWEILR
jgi:Ca2+/H+ antiporter